MECAQFVDRFVCGKFNNNKIMNPELIQFQKHTHSYSCGKILLPQDRIKNGIEQQGNCRLNIPFYPMDETKLLTPLNISDEDASKRLFKEMCLNDLKIVRNYLDEIDPKTIENQQDMELDEFLKTINIS